MINKLPPQWALDKADMVLGHLECSLSDYTRKTATAKIAKLLAEERELCSTKVEQLRKQAREMNDDQWIDEARIRARLCWRDETTKHLVMEPALAEVVARVIASWMETAATYAKNADYWLGKVEQTEEKITAQPTVAAILPPFSDEHIVQHADAYANRCAEHACAASQAAAATAKAYEEFARLAELSKFVGHAEFAKAALYARYAASAAAEYATAAADASTIYLARRAKFNAEYAKYLARPTVQMPNEKTDAEAEADIAALVKAADAALELHQK